LADDESCSGDRRHPLADLTAPPRVNALPCQTRARIPSSRRALFATTPSSGSAVMGSALERKGPTAGGSSLLKRFSIDPEANPAARKLLASRKEVSYHLRPPAAQQPAGQDRSGRSLGSRIRDPAPSRSWLVAHRLSRSKREFPLLSCPVSLMMTQRHLIPAMLPQKLGRFSQRPVDAVRPGSRPTLMASPGRLAGN
jgi:hypothetical protein